MKTVIMAGGKGTRIAGIADGIPKPLIRICGKPVLEHQLIVLKRQGICSVTLTAGYLKEKIIDYFGDGRRFGMEISYILEEKPLGTAGALCSLRGCKEDILLLNGDIMFDVDIKRFYHWHKKKEADITLFTHPNDHPFDSTLIEADENGQVTKIIEREEAREDYANRVNAGIHLVSPRVLGELPVLPCRLDFDHEIVHKWIKAKTVYAYDSVEYVKDMGTPKRYEIVQADCESGLIWKRNLKNRQKAVFLDRDGTINESRGYISSRDQMALLEEAAQAIKILNQSEYLVIIVTNQPVIARGECSFEEMRAIHQRMERMLGEQGAYINGIFICPHHPDSGFEGEISELKIECECRKPKPGMILQAAEKYNIDLQKSYMVGDHKRDIEAGKAAGCRTILAKKGLTIEIAKRILKGTW